MTSSSGGPSKKRLGAHGSRASNTPLFLAALAVFLLGVPATPAQSQPPFGTTPKPAAIAPEWKRSIGEYVPDSDPLTVFERDGQIFLAGKSIGEIAFINHGGEVQFAQIAPGRGFQITKGSAELVEISSQTQTPHEQRDFSFQSQQNARVLAQQSVENLRRVALAASPPVETGAFRKPDLVELSVLDSTVLLDIRYATSNDFLGVAVYTQARAFLQRPAAVALLRAHKKLQPLGYGLLIHDGYRPWYVTKIFWDATPPEGKIFVADPAQGSHHNRGCAVDLTLYDLKSGQPIEMTGAYDEMSPRSFPNYPGGTSLQRWHRDLLRRAMESEGFTVYESEWWHFDFKDWREYPILNIPFEKLSLNSGTTSSN